MVIVPVLLLVLLLRLTGRFLVLLGRIHMERMDSVYGNCDEHSIAFYPYIRNRITLLKMLDLVLQVLLAKLFFGFLGS